MSEQRRLAAIMAVDVAGYSRLMGEDEAGTARAVREHREAARPIVAAHGGRIVKTMGDGVLLEFPSVVAAVECAVAVQQFMAGRNTDTPDGQRIVYRIGVHLGDVLIEGDGIVGDGVNIAARLEALTLDRNMPRAYSVIALGKLAIGRAEEVEADILKAFRLSPRDSNNYVLGMVAGGAKLFQGDDDGAVGWLSRSIEANRNLTNAHAMLASALAHLGRLEEARAAVGAAVAFNPTLVIGRFRKIRVGIFPDPAALPRIERMIDGMRQAGLPEG